MDRLVLMNKTRYFLWSARTGIRADTRCPACRNAETKRLRRKQVVTSLFECSICGLRFRVPKDDPSRAHQFYQGDYSQGFTSDLPSDAELEALLTKGFKRHEKDFRSYIDVIKAAGLPELSAILDFGASWGYGAYQFQRAGFNVIGSEISAPRARYAAEKLHIRMIEDPAHPPCPVDAFFSSHVMEHLPDPNLIWQTAVSALKPGGLFIAFMPNGDPAAESQLGSDRYHRIWGQVHPLLITGRHLIYMATKYGFQPYIYTSPYPVHYIGKKNGVLTGDELCIVARRQI